MTHHDAAGRPRPENDDEAPAAWVESFRRGYHPPPEAPREEMWAAIEARMRTERDRGGEAQVVAIDGARALRRTSRLRARVVAWGAAASVLLALGVGLGRWTARTPEADGETRLGSDAPSTGAPRVGPSNVELAARRHLGRAEPLLMAVRTDSRAGHLDASVEPWARELLLETRLLLDARPRGGGEMHLLLADLELVLMEILGAVEGRGVGEDRLRTETELAVRGLDEREMLPRIRSALPTTMSGR